MFIFPCFTYFVSGDRYLDVHLWYLEANVKLFSSHLVLLFSLF